MTEIGFGTDGPRRVPVRDRRRVENFLIRSLGDLSLRDVVDIFSSGRFFGIEVWSATLVFEEAEVEVWVVLRPVMSYYAKCGELGWFGTCFGSARDAAIYHKGYVDTIL